MLFRLECFPAALASVLFTPARRSETTSRGTPELAMISATDGTEAVLARTVQWDSLLNSRLVTETDVKLIRAYDGQGPLARRAFLEQVRLPTLTGDRPHLRNFTCISPCARMLTRVIHDSHEPICALLVAPTHVFLSSKTVRPRSRTGASKRPAKRVPPGHHRLRPLFDRGDVRGGQDKRGVFPPRTRHARRGRVCGFVPSPGEAALVRAGKSTRVCCVSQIQR